MRAVIHRKITGVDPTNHGHIRTHTHTYTYINVCNIYIYIIHA